MKKTVIAVIAGIMSCASGYASETALGSLAAAVPLSLNEKMSIPPAEPAVFKAVPVQFENPGQAAAAVLKISELVKGSGFWASYAVFEGMDGKSERLHDSSMSAVVKPLVADISAAYWWGFGQAVSDSLSATKLVLTAGTVPSLLIGDKQVQKVKLQVSADSVTFDTVADKTAVRYCLKLLPNGMLEWTEVYAQGTVRLQFKKTKN
jgi:hypothetical protein